MSDKRNIDVGGIITLGSRTKRLSDLLFQQVQEIYDLYTNNFKASWFAILAIVQTQGSIDFKNLASKHNVSSSAISQTMKELERNELVKITPGEDKRSRIISLTKKGENILIEVKPILEKIEDILYEIMKEDSLKIIEQLDNIETELRKKSLLKRYEVKIVNYSKNYQEDFKNLNLAWLKQHFSNLTSLDHEILNSPEKHTIEQGGEIFLAMKDSEVIGTLALIPSEDKESIEISKLTVGENERRKGFATMMLEKAINFAKENEFKKIFVLTSSKLKPALNFYRKNDFVENNHSDSKYDSDRVNKIFTIDL